MKCMYLVLSAVLAIASVQAQARAGILDSAETFAVLGGSTVTNTGASTITGNLGVYAGSAVTGFPPGLVSGGTTYSGNAVAQGAQIALTKAYIGLAAMPVTANLTGQDLGGLTLPSGVYHFDTSAQLTGTLTLNAQGNNDAFWVFQIGSTLTTASGSSVVLSNLGSTRDNDIGVFWQVGSSATLGTTTAFEGNILANQSITLTTGATILNGRALARNGAVTLDTNIISIVCPDGGPGDSGGLMYAANGATVVPVPEPAAILLLASGLAGLFVFRNKAHFRGFRATGSGPSVKL